MERSATLYAYPVVMGQAQRMEIISYLNEIPSVEKLTRDATDWRLAHSCFVPVFAELANGARVDVLK